MDFYDYLINISKKDGVIKNVIGAVITNSESEILILTRKTSDFMGGIDEIPSGNMEKDENIYQALKREIKEETNLDLIKTKEFINYFDYVSSSGKKARQYNFLVEVKNIEDIKLTEHSEYKWQTLEQIRKNSNITDEVKLVLEICNFNSRKQ